MQCMIKGTLDPSAQASLKGDALVPSSDSTVTKMDRLRVPAGNKLEF